MIDLRYAYYLFMKYLPLTISAMTGAYFIYYIAFDDASIDNAKTLFYSALFSSSVGWFTVFMAEERLRKLMLASHSLIQSINAVLEEAKDEDRNEV